MAIKKFLRLVQRKAIVSVVTIAMIVGWYQYSMRVFLIISFVADLFVVWLTQYRLKTTFDSRAYRYMFASFMISALVTGVALLLTFLTLPVWVMVHLAILWISFFALKHLLIAAGLNDLAHDLKETFPDEDMPIKPPSMQQQTGG